MTEPRGSVPALPEYDGAHCVHAAIENASCRACVDACPRHAWHLDDSALEFDAGRCDGCGLCVPACPGRAIKLTPQPARREVAGSVVMVLACDQVSAASGPGRIGCLHAVSLSDLLRAYGNGYGVWLLTRGDCAACPRGAAESLFNRVAHLNVMLRQRGKQALLMREVSSQVSSSLLAAPAVPASRRGFIRALSRRPVAALLGANSDVESGTSKPPGEYLPEGDDAMMPWVVSLDPMRCIGCHACARVCPEGAIRFDALAPAYRLRHRACSGCGLCVNICEAGAVDIRSWAEPSLTSVALAEMRCRSCGISFHTVLARRDVTAQCWICTRSQPSRRLYQVMD